jgi:translation initiation factor IF-2
MGETFRGKVESLHCGPAPVSVARTGQQVGLKIRNFNRAAVGDLVQAFRPGKPLTPPWSVRPGIFYQEE